MILSVEGLRKTYRTRRRGEVVAVDDVSFGVERGSIVGLLGPNGAGKTTTIKCVCTLVTPTAGRIGIDGIDAARDRRAAVERVAAVLEGNRNIYWRLTARENLEFFAALSGRRRREVAGRVDELLEVFGLTEKRDAEGRTLSRGMQQKLAVACALIKDTPVLLLDEPTLGLDVETSHDLRALLRRLADEEGRTILLSSHDMQVVEETCERVIIIDAGRVVTADRVANLLEVFRVRSYRFTLGEPLSEQATSALRSAFPHAEVDGRSVDVQLSDGKRFYDLVDVLRVHGCAVESVDRQDPDLAEVFLRILKGDRR